MTLVHTELEPALCINSKTAPSNLLHTHIGHFFQPPNYSMIEKKGVKKFHWFIHCRKFALQTDHRSLLAILGPKKGLPTHTANRLQRWGTILLNYDFRMGFLPSSKLCHTDGLSRLISKNSEPLKGDGHCFSTNRSRDFKKYYKILCRN